MTTTGIKVNGVDISNIFMAYSSGSKAADTGFKVNGTDISNYFQAYSGGTKAATTKYTAINGNDLCNIFNKVASVPLWYNFGTGITGGLIRGFDVDGSGNVYVGGDSFYFINGVRITYNNGSGGLGKITGFDTSTVVSTAFAQGVTDSTYTVYADNNNNIWAGGWFGSIGPNLNFTTGQVNGTGAMIAKWNGSAWSAFPNSTAGTNGHIERIIVNKANNNIVYVAGNITQVYYNSGTTSVSNFARWNGTAWDTLGFSANATPINKMDVDSTGILYVINGGGISVSNNGANFTTLTNNNSSGGTVISGTINNIFVDSNNDLWAVGSFYVAKYTKSTGYWSSIGDATSVGFIPTCLYGSDNYIYVAAGTSIKYYNTTTSTWSSNMITSMTVGGITNIVYKNSALYIAGNFTNVNGVNANYIATYR
jgi:hypothetical protein